MVCKVHSNRRRSAKAIDICKGIEATSTVYGIVTEGFGAISRSDVIISIARIYDVITP